MLADLTAGSVSDATAREDVLPLKELERHALDSPPAIDATLLLARGPNVKIIAEVKRASPSKGDLATIADPAALAKIYESAGASAISVLTEERKFKGNLADLYAVRAHVSVPVLRKDFIANRYQVFEARAAGADMVLLIVAALELETLKSLYLLATQLGMAVLVETHTDDEVRTAVDLGAKIVGVNARDLSTFELDRDLFGRVADLIPAGTVRIAESAVRSVQDVQHYRSAGADVVLVGEALVTGDPLVTLTEFLAVS